MFVLLTVFTFYKTIAIIKYLITFEVIIPNSVLWSGNHSPKSIRLRLILCHADISRTHNNKHPSDVHFGLAFHARKPFTKDHPKHVACQVGTCEGCSVFIVCLTIVRSVKLARHSLRCGLEYAWIQHFLKNL